MLAACTPFCRRTAPHNDTVLAGPFRQTAHRRCFHLPQLDPVEAKRQDILAMLRVAARDAPGTDDGAAACLTRPNLVRGLELYGQHFQRHLPILHAATFDMTRCAPHLLLAMFCCGASYDHAIASTQQIYSLARRALVDIAMQRVGTRGGEEEDDEEKGASGDEREND